MRSALLIAVWLLAGGCRFDAGGLPLKDELDGSAGDAAVPTVDAAAPDADAAVAPVDADVPPVDAAPPPDAELPPCFDDSDYTERPGHPNRYRLEDTPSNWSSASGDCADDGAHLVVIDDQAENDFVRGLTDTPLVWIGLTDADDEGTFVWDNGDPLDFEHWDPEEPNSKTPIEDCVEMQLDGEWNDENCGASREFVCECDPAYRR